MDFNRIKSILPQHTLAPDEWKGAVLFLCNEEYIFLIKRSELMPTHRGQIAFIGGHRQPLEDHPWPVAQREFEEETSFNRNHLEYLGCLPAVLTSRAQLIVPVMARTRMDAQEFLAQAQSNGEWDDILAYPWTALVEEKNWEYAWRHGEDKCAVMFHSIRPRSYLHMNQNFHPHLLWGATAHMIWAFLRLYFNK